MNRRDFLKMLGLTGLVAAAPKIIFDMGANSHLYLPEYEFFTATFDWGEISAAAIQMKFRGEVYRHAVRMDTNLQFPNRELSQRLEDRFLEKMKPHLIEWAEEKQNRILGRPESSIIQLAS